MITPEEFVLLLLSGTVIGLWFYIKGEYDDDA